jgi:hypothetical protein
MLQRFVPIGVDRPIRRTALQGTVELGPRYGNSLAKQGPGAYNH